MVEEDPVEVIEEDPQYYPLSDDDDSPDTRVGGVVSSPDMPLEGGDDHHDLPNGFQ